MTPKGQNRVLREPKESWPVPGSDACSVLQGKAQQGLPGSHRCHLMPVTYPGCDSGLGQNSVRQAWLSIRFHNILRDGGGVHLQKIPPSAAQHQKSQIPVIQP